MSVYFVKINSVTKVFSFVCILFIKNKKDQLLEQFPQFLLYQIHMFLWSHHFIYILHNHTPLPPPAF